MRMHYVLQVRDEENKIIDEKVLGVKWEPSIVEDLRCLHGVTFSKEAKEFLKIELLKRVGEAFESMNINI